jgi:hypothetical protein
MSQVEAPDRRPPKVLEKLREHKWCTIDEAFEMTSD